MEVLSDDILKFHEDTLHVVRKQYGLDKPGAMQQALDILDEWIKQQDHFTRKDFDREYLERVIITCKGSIERAKERLDKLFTLRTLMPKYFKDFDVKTDFKNIEGVFTHVILPQMTEEYDRVYLVKCKGKFYPKLYLEGYIFSLLLTEYLTQHDYAISYYTVFDYRDCSVSELLANIDIVEIREAIAVSMQGFGIRLRGVHIVTNSTLLDKIMSIGKSVVSKKVRNRIHCHKNLEELYKHVPRNVFPKDYGGGDEKTLSEIDAEWRRIFSTDDYRDYRRVMNSARTNESLRQKNHFNDQYMGMPGTFRALTVD